MTDGMAEKLVPAGGVRRSSATGTWWAALLTGLAVAAGPAAAEAHTPGRDEAAAVAPPHAVTAVAGTMPAVAVAEPATGTLAVTPAVAAVLALPLPHRFGTPVPDGGLARQRGGAALPSSEMKLDGAVGNNAATNVVTGANVISDGAFSNASGLPMVIQNSGANVLIQNATIVNVQFE